MTKIEDQPAPEFQPDKRIWELVVEDMQARDQVGRQRYGTPLQTFNGRDALVDAYQEALDLAVYLRQQIEEDKSYQRLQFERVTTKLIDHLEEPPQPDLFAKHAGLTIAAAIIALVSVIMGFIWFIDAALTRVIGH